MRWMLIGVFAAAAVAQDQTGSVAGVVTDSVTHMGVRKAQVMLYPQRVSVARLAPGQDRPQMPVTSTDSSGNFVFSGLAPGTYQVNVQHTSYPQRPGFRPQITTVDVKAGSEPSRIAIELTPGATVTGRIVDEDGDPIPDCYVQIMAPPSRGPNQFIGALGSEQSNDQGVYRVYGIAPGKVIALANCGRPAFQPRPLLPVDAPPQPPSVAYVPQYYPGSADVSGAQAIELAAGAVREGVDFHMAPTRVYTVKGTVALMPGANRPERGGGYVMMTKRDAADQASRMSGTKVGSIDWTNGTFTIMSVPPGSYTLTLQGSGAQMDVDVVDRPVEVALQVRPALELKGSVVVEGETKTPINRLSFTFLQETPMGMAGGPANFQPKEDGSFTVAGVAPGRYMVRVSSIEVYVKSVTVGGQDAPNNLIDLRNGAAELRIVLSSRMATIAGTAPAGRMVYIHQVSTNPMEIAYGTRATSADQQGSFRLPPMAPGKYRIMLDGDAEGGQEISVAEGETVNVELKAPVAQ